MNDSSQEELPVAAQPDDNTQFSEEPQSLPCWRCGLDAPGQRAKCPHCGAANRSAAAQTLTLPPASGSSESIEWQVKLVFGAYAVILATGVLHGLVFGLRFEGANLDDPRVKHAAMLQVAIAEAADAVVVVAALLAMRGLPPRRQPSSSATTLAWTVSVPVLCALVGVNFAYHAYLNEILRLPLIERDLLSEWSAWSIVLVCVQPAIVEELFFRGFALRWLQSVMGPHGAVWIAALMFGMVHVAALFSIPYLVLAGVVFGYVAVATGRLWLPMILHFLHNFVLIWVEST